MALCAATSSVCGTPGSLAIEMASLLIGKMGIDTTILAQAKLTKRAQELVKLVKRHGSTLS